MMGLLMRKKGSFPEKGEIKAFLGPGCHFEGNLSFEEIVRLDGIFSGKIKSRDALIIGQTAQIEADIEVGHLILSGTFKGNIKASVKVELRSPAKVEGDIQTPLLSMEEGVVYNGSLSMTGAGDKLPVPEE